MRRSTTQTTSSAAWPLLPLLLAIIMTPVSWSTPARAQDASAQDTIVAPPANATARLERDGLKLELTALNGDTVRAFFMGRGFEKPDADVLVDQACVFRSAIGSAFTAPGSPQVTVSLLEWRVISPDTSGTAGRAAPKTREDWEPVWKNRKAAPDAQVAFYWALFPTKQTFAATDYNWGMLTFGLPAKTKFTLEIKWQSGQTQHNANLENLQCGN